MEKAQKIKLITSFVFAVVVFVFLPTTVSAATMYFFPSTGEYVVGKTFSVNVYVSSADQAMNAASGIISFPQDKLEVLSLSKTDSIFNLWVQEPSFSNSAGTINFEGIVLNPGFVGLNGKAITITFRTKAVGNALLTFSSGSALANDGKGTNILSSLGSALFNVSASTVSPQVLESTTPSEIVGVPAAPRIFSSTHPDTNKWYADNNPKFEWSLSEDVNGVNVLVDRNPNTNPGTRSDGLFSSYTYENVEDGVWYFHIRLRNNAGWGNISHFRFQIDTEKPSSFSIQEIKREDLTNPRAKFRFDAKDETSGIDYYEVRINERSPQVWQDDGSGIYETPPLDPGKYILIAKAIDKAGNALINFTEFEIKPLDRPFITDAVVKSEIFRVGSWAINFLSLVIPLVLLIFALLFIIWYGWHKFSLFKKRVRKETKETKESLYQAFKALKEEMEKQVAKLDSNPDLNEREKKICNNLKKALKISEEFISKEIGDIEKEIKK